MPSDGILKSSFTTCKIKEGDKLPQIICRECCDFIISLIKFSERANKVQQMYDDLRNSINKSTTNLQKLLGNYGIKSHEDKSLLQQQRDKSLLQQQQQDKSKLPQSGMGLTVDELFVTDLVDNTITMQIKTEGKDEFISTTEQIEETTSTIPSRTTRRRTFKYKETEIHDPIGPEDQDFGTSTEHDFSSGSEDNWKDESLSKIKVQTKAKRKSIFNSKSKSMEVSVDASNEYCCKICSEHFKRRSNYTVHMKKKHGVFNCSHCSKEFISELDVVQHKQEQHRQVWTCLYCEEAFEKKRLRSEHMLMEHEIKGNNQWVCDVSGDTFLQMKQLNQHVLTHTNNESLYACKICGKTFKWKYTLKGHMEIHGDKFVCTECGKQLSSRKLLKNHMLVHSDAMRHKCDVCGRGFKRAKTLKYHLIAHTGLKPYSCDFCGKTFSTGSSCRFHKKTMHPNELAELEASGAKAYTKNVPSMSELREVARTGTNLRPLMSKQNGYAPKS
ncbi:zinc finger protein OZF-like isoform X2 [Eurosta solidaginis]|uniref:zinc finger protein OZF-like isoform X2 n=1 Tax=Eurosta solidaginis TaxID=178769 RepID=UPI003530F3EC